MSISALTGVGATQGTRQQPSKTQMAGSELGEDAFMTLLLAQLKNQDPLKPMEDRDFIAQLAQFNSLSQLTQMNKTLSEMITTQSMAQASALIGKTVAGTGLDGSDIAGVVTGLHLSSGKVVLDVAGKELPLNGVRSVTQTQTGEEN